MKATLSNIAENGSFAPIFSPLMRGDQARVVSDYFEGLRDASPRATSHPIVEADTSWDIREATVLRVRYTDQLFTVKVGANYAYPIERELRAHPTYTRPLSAIGRAPQLLCSNKSAHVAIMTHLSGELVEGTPREWDPGIYREAGRLLRIFHNTESRIDKGYEHALRLRTLNRLTEIPPGASPLPRDIEQAARFYLENFTPQPTKIVPTHGDYQPRNWLWDKASHHGKQGVYTETHPENCETPPHPETRETPAHQSKGYQSEALQSEGCQSKAHRNEGCLKIIDFGRFGWRPPSTDFARLAAGQFISHPELEAAFVEGYGGDPRTTSVVEQKIGESQNAHNNTTANSAQNVLATPEHAVESWWIGRLADGLGTFWYATTRGYNEEFAEIGIQMCYTALKYMEELGIGRYS